MADLLALADRVEKEAAGSRELDVAIAQAIWPQLSHYAPHCRGEEPIFWEDPFRKLPCPKFTASLDAAMKLVPEDAWWEVIQTCAPTSPMRNFGSRNGMFRARTAKNFGERGAMAENDHPAMALVAAALRALANNGSAT